MTNNDELAQLKQLATFMTERFSMNPVSCKILNEDWKKRFPDDAAVAETLVALLAERDADKKRIAELQKQLARYSMSPGEADQRRCESRAVRDALGFGKDADNVAPVDLREKISALRLRIHELEARTVSVKLPENIPCPGAPQTIWLQTNGDDSNESSWPENSNDVSWCWEKIFHNDTLYVRADLAAGIKLEVGE